MDAFTDIGSFLYISLDSYKYGCKIVLKFLKFDSAYLQAQSSSSINLYTMIF